MDNETQTAPLLSEGDEEANRNSFSTPSLGVNHKNQNNEKNQRRKFEDQGLLPDNVTCNDKVNFAFSKSNKNRKRNIACSLFFVISIIMVPLMLFVILPNVVQSMVDGSTITILQTAMKNPTNTSFSSEVSQTFDNIGGFPAKSTMHDTSLYWHNEDGEDILIADLDQFEEIDIKEGVVVKMNSKAHLSETVTQMMEFNADAQDRTTLHWRIKGKADLTTSLIPGMVFTVELDKRMTLNGFDGFPVAPVTHQSNTTGGSVTTLYNVARSTFYSAADIAIYFNQDLHMHMSYQGVRFGIGTIKDASIIPGYMDSIVYVEMSPKTDEEWYTVSKVTSNFACGNPTNVELGPFFLSNPITWLEPSLNSMNLKSSLPGNKDKGIIQTDMYPAKVFSPLKTPFTLTMYNPIDAQYTVTSMHSKIYTNGVLLATVTENNLNIVIPPRGVIITEVMHSQASTTPAAGKAYDAMKAAGFGYVDIFSQLQIKIGDFAIPSSYNQSHTLAIVHSSGP